MHGQLSLYEFLMLDSMTKLHQCIRGLFRIHTWILLGGGLLEEGCFKVGHFLSAWSDAVFATKQEGHLRSLSVR